MGRALRPGRANTGRRAFGRRAGAARANGCFSNWARRARHTQPERARPRWRQRTHLRSAPGNLPRARTQPEARSVRPSLSLPGIFVVSSAVSRASAAVLGSGGLALLFAADVLLPALVPGLPPTAAWLGQLLGAAWLGVAALNWLQRGAVLGGIYGRPVVFANLVLYSVTALSAARALPAGGPGLWLVVAPAAAGAAVYGALLFRGPFGHGPAGVGAAG